VRRCIFVLAGLVLGGCTPKGAPESKPDEVWYPADAVGPFKAGTEESRFTGRTGVEMDVQVWDPSEDDSTKLHKYDDLRSWDALDAPEPACSRTRPVVAFSHGNQSIRWQSPFLVERLASHGFVVVAPTHTGNSTFDFDDSRLPEMIFRRPLDIQDAVDWLFETGVAELGLEDCVDRDAGYAVTGHSFGGYTATAIGGAEFDYAASSAYCDEIGGWLCDELEEWVSTYPEYATAELADDRVWASIPMAPAGFEVLGAGAGLAETPFLVLGAEWDELTPMDSQVEPIYEALGSEEKMMGNLLESGHMVFSSACELTYFEECDAPYLPIEEGHPTINTAVMAFLQMQLGNPDAASYLPFNSPLWEWSTP
jgi:predicted dienelactone hydrolase